MLTVHKTCRSDKKLGGCVPVPSLAEHIPCEYQSMQGSFSSFGGKGLGVHFGEKVGKFSPN